MFTWHERAQVCYAYLDEVCWNGDIDRLHWDFGICGWLKRGWTLQELLVPSDIVFLDRSWRELGTKATLLRVISEASGISMLHLQMTPHPDKEDCQIPGWRMASIAQKMSWSSCRSTSRIEDEAYCLMGLFDVNMPLLYGEGTKAFRRLQVKIINQSDDQSILARTGFTGYSVGTRGILARSPRSFRYSGRVEKPMTRVTSLVNKFDIARPRTRPLVVASNQLEVFAPLIITSRFRRPIVVQSARADIDGYSALFWTLDHNMHEDTARPTENSSSTCLKRYSKILYDGCYYHLDTSHVVVVLNCTWNSSYACGIVFQPNIANPGYYERVEELGIIQCSHSLLDGDDLYNTIYASMRNEVATVESSPWRIPALRIPRNSTCGYSLWDVITSDSCPTNESSQRLDDLGLTSLEELEPFLLIFISILDELPSFVITLLRVRCCVWAKLETPVVLNRVSFIDRAKMLKDSVAIADLRYDADSPMPGAVDIYNEASLETMVGRRKVQIMSRKRPQANSRAKDEIIVSISQLMDLA